MVLIYKRTKITLCLFWICLLLVGNYQNAFGQKITGKITDQTGEALIGVNIIIKGTTTGTISDANGFYSIDIPSPETVLQFSFIGYNTEEIPVEGRTEINVLMVPSLEELNEVVVIGYGVQKKSDLTGSVVSVKSEDIGNLPTSSVTQALQGRAAGVNVTANSGSPGGDMSVRIRGIGSINNNDPLVVIDGFPSKGGLGSINPDDVERIDVLKDASATAIYGARGANGVIIVTTKRGKSGKTEFTFDSYYGVEQFGKKYELLNAVQYAKLYNEEVINSQLQNNKAPVPYFYYNPGGPGYSAAADTVPIDVWLPRDSADVDWIDAVTQPGVVQSYTLSARGGNENNQFSISGTYFDQKGVIKGSGYTRLSLLLNTDNKMNKRLKVGNSLNFNVNKRSSLIEEGPGRTVLSRALSMMPILEPYRPDGTFSCANDNPGGTRNPLRDALQDTRESNWHSITGTLYADYTLFDGLTFRITGGANYYSFQYKQFEPVYGIPGDKWFNTDADASRTFSRSYNLLLENQLTYIKTFGKHNLTALAAYTSQQDYSESLTGAVEGFTHPNLQQLSSGILKKDIQGGVQEWALLSQLGRLMYDFDSRYYITGSVRRDGSSRFGEENRYGIFPSFALKWRLSNESFLKGLGFLNDLSLRGGYGRVGNQEIGNYSAYARLTSVSWVSGDVLLENVGMAPNAMPNSAVRWESTKMTNIGLDASVFDNRFMLSVEYYVRGTDGMLLQKPIPTTSGYTSLPFVNVGEIENKGWDATLMYRGRMGEFKYDLSLNGNLNKNEVTNLGGASQILGGSLADIGGGYLTLTKEKNPVGAFYGFVMNGIFQSAEEIKAAPFQSTTTRPGDVRFADLNGDGKISNEDRTFIGNPWPDVSYGFNSSFGYKGIALDLFFQGVKGNDIYFVTQQADMNSSGNQHVRVLDRWTPDNPSTSIPRAILGDPSQNSRISTRYLEDGSYLRLKNLVISYELPGNLTKKINVSRVQIYVSGTNLITFTQYTGVDPEIGENGTLYSGIDRGQYPVTKTLAMGLKLAF